MGPPHMLYCNHPIINFLPRSLLPTHPRGVTAVWVAFKGIEIRNDLRRGTLTEIEGLSAGIVEGWSQEGRGKTPIRGENMEVGI